MSDFCYVIELSDGTCLYLSEEDGPVRETRDFAESLNKRGFNDEEVHPLGENTLRVFKKKMPATDIVPAK